MPDAGHDLDGTVQVSRLDDETDRTELRDRYYGLLQELRVVVTGVQVLLAFLLTVPFTQRFSSLDESAQAWFGVALTCATLSVITFVTPIAMHRLGKRTARVDRLAVSIVLARVGLVLLGLAMLVSFAVVINFLFDSTVTVLIVGLVSMAMLGMWVLVPLATRRTDGRRSPR